MRVPVSALLRVEASADSLCAHTEVLQHIFQNAVLLHIELQGMNLDGHMSITEMVTAPREGVPVIALSLYKRFGLRVDQDDDTVVRDELFTVLEGVSTFQEEPKICAAL